jgi:serine/threonine protein kinase
VESTPSEDDLSNLRRETTSFGAYRILEKIAGGGMAEIYKVRRDAEPSELYALKLVRADRSDDPEFRQMLIDEAKIASRLRHPNIARVIELQEHSGELGLILQFVAGIDLIRAARALRERDEVLRLDAALYLLLEVLAGLEFAHQVRDDQGELLHVVHRDVSPGNIMIDVDGHVRIVDWGIARAKNRVAQTDVGHVKGKFRYMAPEQITGQAVGPAADIYSAMITFWELLANERAYDETELPQLMMKVSRGEAPRLEDARPGLPKKLLQVYKKATHKDPSRRYDSAGDLADDIEALELIGSIDEARARLRRLAVGARLADGRRRYERAVRDAKVSASKDDLEGALLRALQEPDRVERVDLDDSQPVPAERLVPRGAGSVRPISDVPTPISHP